MTKKIVMFMMGVFALSGLGLSFASAGGNTTPSTAQMGFGLNEGYTKDISGIAGAGSNKGDGLLTVIKRGINWILGILGLITFVLLLWGGFQMVTAAGDDKKFGAWQTILKQAGIGLLFIGGSWLMVSMIFWLIWTFTSWT